MAFDEARNRRRNLDKEREHCQMGISHRQAMQRGQAMSKMSERISFGIVSNNCIHGAHLQIGGIHEVSGKKI